MTKCIWIESKGNIIFHSDFSDYVPYFISGYVDYAVFNKKTSTFSRVNEKDIENYIDRSSINTTPFCFYDVDKDAAKVKKIKEIENSDIPYTKWVQNYFSFEPVFKNYEILKNSSVMEGENSFLRFLSADYYDSRAKKSKEIVEIVKNLIEENEGFNSWEKSSSPVLFKKELSNGSTLKVTSSIYHKKMYVNVETPVNNSNYTLLNDSVFEAEKYEGSVKDFFQQFSDEMIDNKEVIYGSFNSILLPKKKAITDLLAVFQWNEVLIKEKYIIQKLASIKAEIDTLSITDFFETQDGNFFDDFKENKEKLVGHTRHYDIFMRDKEDHSSSLETSDVFKLLKEKQDTLVPDLHSEIKNIEKKEILQWKFISADVNKLETVSEWIDESLLQLVEEWIDEIEQDLKVAIEKYKPSETKEETKLQFQTVKITNTEDNSPYMNQIQRSKAFAESMSSLSEITGLYKDITSFQLTSETFDQFREKISRYKKLSESLKVSYSWEGWLLMTKEVIQSVLTYVALNNDITEQEEMYYKDFLYSNTGNLLNHLHEVFIEDKDTDKVLIVKKNMDILSAIIPEKESFHNLSNFLNNVLDNLERENISQDDLDGFKVSNESWKGSYYTPNSFWEFLKPLVENTSSIYQTNVLDVSAGKGTLLDYIDGENIKKIGNDINPLSLKVLFYTQGFDFDSILESTNIDEVRKIVSRSQLITTNSSAISYMDFDIEADFFLSNPPYIKSPIWSKERENILKENKIKNITNGNVNMVEFTYKGLINKLKFWGAGMLISSARGISKIEQKVKIDTDDYLVPLYRIWVSGRPFKKEWVDLAPISISWDDVYVYGENGLEKNEADAEFFVTLYTRLNKKDQEKFWNVAPTFLLDFDEIKEFNQYVMNNIDDIDVLSNYKNYLSVNRKVKLEEVREFFNTKNGLNPFTVPEGYITKETFQDLIKNTPNINEFIDSKNTQARNINKIKFMKVSSSISLRIEEMLDKFRKIDDRLIPLSKEALKGHLNSKSIKNILKKEYGLEFNGYSFNISKDSKITKVWEKYMFGDKDITHIMTFPFPYSLHTLPLNTYSDLISKYLVSLSSDDEVIRNKIQELEAIFDEFIAMSGEKGFKVIHEIGRLWLSDVEKTASFIIDKFDEIQGASIKEIDLLSKEIIWNDPSASKENVQNLLFAIRQNNSLIEVVKKNPKSLNYVVKKFTHGYKLTHYDRSLIEQSKKSVTGLKQHIRAYAKNNNTQVFDEIDAANHKNSISLLNHLGKILIKELDKGNNHFPIVDIFKTSKSILLKEFSCIETYTSYKELMKVDAFFRDISFIDQRIDKIDGEIDFIFKHASSAVEVKKFIPMMGDEVHKYLEETNEHSIGIEKIVSLVRTKLLKNKYLDRDKFTAIRKEIESVSESLSIIKQSEIKALYQSNIDALYENVYTLERIHQRIYSLDCKDPINTVYSKYMLNDDNITFIKDIKSILDIESERQVLDYYTLKSIKEVFLESVNKSIIDEINSLGDENPLSKIIWGKISKNYEMNSEFHNIQTKYQTITLDKEVSELEDSNNMLLNVYKNDIAEWFRNEYKNRVAYIDTIVGYYKEKEQFIQVAESKDESRKRAEELLNYSKFLTINTNEYERIIILDYIRKNWMTSENVNDYVSSNSHMFGQVNSENFKDHIIQKHNEYGIYGKEMAESIILSLWVKSNYSKLYSNIFLDIESELLRENNKEEIFKKDFLDFQAYLEERSPYEEVIILSNKYASLLSQKSLLRKREPLLKDLMEIEIISDFVSTNEFSELWDSEIVEILTSNKELKKIALENINSNISEIEVKLENKDALIEKNTKRLNPTFVQSKALYKFQKSLESNNGLVKLLNQSEVGTGKTFTMPFYEALLDDTFKTDLPNFKLYITEANLVSNTTKSLIENGKMPGEILEGKISSFDEIEKIIKFIKNGWSNLILSSASLYNYDVDNIKILAKFLEKNIWNIYLYADEATFLKNTETNSYAWFKKLLGELKKTKKLRLQNYLTATPVNNDNGDFLYLLELFNKKDILKYIKQQNLTPNGQRELFKLMTLTDNLKLGRKEEVIIEWKASQYYYVPNIVYLLEYIRTWSEHSLTRFHMNGTIEIPDPFNKEKTKYVSMKSFYEEYGISFKQISKEEFDDKRYVFDNPLFFNSKNEDLAYKLTNLFKNINIVNFDRNLNSIGLKGNTSQLYKTYYSLTPSLIESMIIESFISEVSRVQKFKKISNAIAQVKKKWIYQIDRIISKEGRDIFNNILLEVADVIGIDSEKSTYSVSRKVKKGYKEVEESTTYNKFKVKKSDIEKIFENEDSDLYIFNSKIIDSIFMNVDIISYSNYKNKISEIWKLRQKGVSESVIIKEEKELNKYLWNIYTVVGNFIWKNIPVKATREDLIERLKEWMIEWEFLETVEMTYIEKPEILLEELQDYTKEKWYGSNQIQKVYFDLEKNSSGSALSERSYIIQLLEDFNTPLGAIFIEKVIRNMSVEWKSKWVDIKLNDDEILKIKDYIISSGNTLSWTLNSLAVCNSEKKVNTFITTNYVNTVLNLHKEISKSSKEVYMITGKYVKTSKEKLKIINDFDKLDSLWKTLVATSKSVEKGLSIFNAMKWYTTIGDENAWALTQRIWRFRTLMDKQLQDLSEFDEKIENGEIKMTPTDKEMYQKNIENLKSNKKEFFILSNKLSESMLQNSEVKNILLQKVNSTSMFDGVIDFNDDYFGTDGWSFNVANVLNWVKKIIENDKIKFFERLTAYDGTIDGKILHNEISKNINRNIKSNIESIHKVEGIKIEAPISKVSQLPLS